MTDTRINNRTIDVLYYRATPIIKCSMFKCCVLYFILLFTIVGACATYKKSILYNQPLYVYIYYSLLIICPLILYCVFYAVFRFKQTPQVVRAVYYSND